jgi:HEAT repeat protein
MRFVENDNDADVRASAAWAISTHDKVRDIGPTLSKLAEREPSAEVRQRLYEALLPQNVIPAERLLPIVQAEAEIAALVAGFNAIGRAAYQQPGSPVALAFDQQIVPELVQIAMGSSDLNIQMRAVFALRRARTPAAIAALTTIAYNARPQIAAAASNGLR